MYRNVIAELKRKGMTQADLAKEMALARSTMSAKLNGKANLSLKEARKIKSILGVDIPIESLFQEQTA